MGTNCSDVNGTRNVLSNVLCRYVAKQCICHIWHRNYDVPKTNITYTYLPSTPPKETVWPSFRKRIQHELKCPTIAPRILLREKMILHIWNRNYAPLILLVENNILYNNKIMRHELYLFKTMYYVYNMYASKEWISLFWQSFWKWTRRELNTQPSDLESNALPLRHGSYMFQSIELAKIKHKEQKTFIELDPFKLFS